MTLNVGVVGVGMIGQDHIRRLTHVLAGVRVAAVNDVDLDRAKAVAGGLPQAQVYNDGHELIRADDVDAVLVASSGPTHEQYVLAGIEAGKQVFCEKPPATTREACEQHNEIGHGDLDWTEFFGTLRDMRFDGIATVCVFGWEEDADDIHLRMLDRVRSELSG
jgi:Oxidoreductase family, NAD-binding Rossmann fold